VLASIVLPASAALGQSWQWPWENQPRPIPSAPVYRPPGIPAPIPPGSAVLPPPQANLNRSPICLQLEQRLAQESTRGAQGREQLPRIEQEIRQIEKQLRPVEIKLDRDCFEFFFFAKSLRQTRECVNANALVEQSKRRLVELETQRQQLISTSGRSYQDDIVRELARNNCGANYQQEAARRGGSIFGGWQDEDSIGGNSGLGNNGAPIGTYRTVCVRLCDGYYFPVSFSTLPNHFERDEDLCRSRCEAPAELYYYQNPGGTPDQMVSAKTRQPITQLKTAFRFRKEYVQGCSCKKAEYVPSASPERRGDVAPAASAQVPRSIGSTGRTGTAQP
jgi:hypothetical protein